MSMSKVDSHPTPSLSDFAHLEESLSSILHDLRKLEFHTLSILFYVEF